MAGGSTFEKYGGFKTVSRVVIAFYEKVLDDDMVGHHFDGIDMGRLIDHQTKFISSVMGGPVSITDDLLHHVHARLMITGPEFDRIQALLAETLSESGIESDDVQFVIAGIERKRGLIVRGAAA